jgi:hypothetical protein
MIGSVLDLSVAAARSNDEVITRLVEMTGLTARKLANRLQSSDGRTRLRNAFAKELPLVYESLGKLNVKQVRTWGIGAEIARVWGLSDERVEEVLGSVHGRTLVQRAFKPVEPSSDDEPDGEDGVDEPTLDVHSADGDELAQSEELRLYGACVYAIVDEDTLLAADQGDRPSKPLTEGKSWAAAAKWIASAGDLGERVPIVFADAKFVHRWLGWGLLAGIKIERQGEHKSQTTYRFQSLRPFVGHRRSEFLLLDQGSPVSDAHIRSYVRVATPDFLRDLAARNDAPLLSEWLKQTEAVAQVFDAAFEDDTVRRAARVVLGRAVKIVDEMAPGNWGVVLTPGRIRVIVGEGVVVDLGNSPGEFLFWLLPDPENPDEAEDDDDTLALTELFRRHEAGFRRKLEAVRSTRRDDLRHAEAVLDYLRALEVLPARSQRDDQTRRETSSVNGSGDAGVGWTRPRPIRALFAQLGLPVPNDLSQEEFGSLIEALENRGFEVATMDGAIITPLHDAVPIDAELRVRHDAFAASPASLRATIGEVRENAAAGGTVPVSDYERAVFRLELLTAGLGPEHVSPEWVARCVEVAAVGLAVHDSEQVLLGRVGESLARTFRNPLVVLTSLVRRLHAEDGDVLLREYAALHPEDSDMQVLLPEHWAALCQAPRLAGGP